MSFQVKSMKEKKAEKQINDLFKGLDHDELKLAMLITYAGYDPKLMKELTSKYDVDYEELIKELTITDPQQTVMTQEEINERQAEINSNNNNNDK